MACNAIWFDECFCNLPILNEPCVSRVLAKVVLVFFDDLLVYSLAWRLHLVHLETILKLLQ